MRTVVNAVAALVSAALFAGPSFAQTYSNCNPTLRTDCPPDSALGKSVKIDFSSPSDSFTPQGSPTYGSDGVSFTVAKSGDSPQITSKWYIMFGKVEVVLKAAPGAGIVSSFVMQSDDLDEIDWEWLGVDGTQVQTNYFGKGLTTSYNRGAFHANPGNQADFIKYGIEWTANQIVWQINGVTVRTLEPETAEGQYPQSPMQIKIGAWSGGDSANAEGTIQWAHGPTDYTQGPFTMSVKSLTVEDYSTGSQYTYGDQSGTWQSIKSNGGKINGGGTPVQSNAPAVTSSSNGQPIPFSPSHGDSTAVQPSIFPWVPQSTTLTAKPSVATENYPGLPSGWTVSSSGKVVPPSAAPPPSPPASSTLSPAASPSASPLAAGDSGSKTITTYDTKGFATVFTVPADYTPPPRSYDDQGFLITSSASKPTTTAPIGIAQNAVQSPTPSPKPAPASSAYKFVFDSSLFFIAALAGVVVVL